ncbi:MAG: hypothetical protein K2Q14_05445 [Gammaproteobacteria bacterium]|nr:hypothetical protein [Gammaproteobacteria bacterium]
MNNIVEIKYKKTLVALMHEMKQFNAYRSQLYLSYEHRGKHIGSLLYMGEITYHRTLRLTRKSAINESKKDELVSLGDRLEAHIAAATQLSQASEFKKDAYDVFFRQVNQHIGSWGNKVLYSEHCKDLRQQHRPITQFLKRIGNILLPFTVVGPLIKMGLHGKNHAYSNCRTRIEDLAGDLLVNIGSKTAKVMNTQAQGDDLNTLSNNITV